MRLLSSSPSVDRPLSEPFNECYVDTSTTILDGRSLVYTCNLSTGETQLTVYEDQECSEFYLSTGGTGSCFVADIFDDDDGDVCLEEEACSSNETCTDDGEWHVYGVLVLLFHAADVP